MSKKNIDWGWYGYVAIVILIIAVIIFSMISYMSLNNWDIRCVFTECHPVTIREGENEA